MEYLRQRLGCIAVTSAIATIAGFIVLLVIRAALLFRYDIFDTHIDARLICVAFFPVVFGILWLSYKGAFIGETYTDQERRAITQQLWTLIVAILMLFLLVVTQQPFMLVLIGLVVAYVGMNAITTRVSLLALRSFGRARNRGWSAVIIGMMEMALAIYILSFAVRAIWR
jgi:hypothetical protein